MTSPLPPKSAHKGRPFKVHLTSGACCHQYYIHQELWSASQQYPTSLLPPHPGQAQVYPTGMYCSSSAGGWAHRVCTCRSQWLQMRLGPSSPQPQQVSPWRQLKRAGPARPQQLDLGATTQVEPSRACHEFRTLLHIKWQCCIRIWHLLCSILRPCKGSGLLGRPKQRGQACHNALALVSQNLVVSACLGPLTCGC